MCDLCATTAASSVPVTHVVLACYRSRRAKYGCRANAPYRLQECLSHVSLLKSAKSAAISKESTKGEGTPVVPCILVCSTFIRIFVFPPRRNSYIQVIVRLLYPPSFALFRNVVGRDCKCRPDEPEALLVSQIPPCQ